MKRTLPTILIAGVLAAGLVGCSGSPAPTVTVTTGGGSDAIEETEAASDDATAPETEVVDLAGEWVQNNSNSEDDYQAATITDSEITIYWVSDGGDTRSLYWAGTVDVAADAGTSFSWDSVNDHEQTDMAILASGDDTKTFTFEYGEISYEVSALGTTTVVRLSPAE